MTRQRPYEALPASVDAGRDLFLHITGGDRLGIKNLARSTSRIDPPGAGIPRHSDSVVTQNIDDLHERAGQPERKSRNWLRNCWISIRGARRTPDRKGTPLFRIKALWESAQHFGEVVFRLPHSLACSSTPTRF